MLHQLIITLDTSVEPVDVVLLEGWMLGFNPLPHIPLPVDPRSLLVRLSNTTTATTAETDTTAAVVTQRGEMAAEVSLVERQQQQQHKQQQQQLQESDRKPQDHQPVEQPTVSEEEVEAFEVAHNKARSLQVVYVFCSVPSVLCTMLEISCC